MNERNLYSYLANSVIFDYNHVKPYCRIDLGTTLKGRWYDYKDVCYYIDHIYADVEKRTIVVKWIDGNKTKVKLQEGDNWDLEAGVNAAIVKYLTDSHNSYKKFIQNSTTYVVKKDK